MTIKLLGDRVDFIIDNTNSTNQDHLDQAVKNFIDGYQPAMGRDSGIQHMVEDMVIERSEEPLSPLFKILLNPINLRTAFLRSQFKNIQL